MNQNEDHDPTQSVNAKEEAEDYYMDGPYVVFTAAFHRKRGFCCGSGCRHCPYREEPSPES